MTYFSSDQKLSMIKAIVDSSEEFDIDCNKVEKIREILNLNNTLDVRDKLRATNK